MNYENLCRKLVYSIWKFFLNLKIFTFKISFSHIMFSPQWPFCLSVQINELRKELAQKESFPWHYSIKNYRIFKIQKTQQDAKICKILIVFTLFKSIIKYLAIKKPLSFFKQVKISYNYVICQKIRKKCCASGGYPGPEQDLFSPPI